jgi:hypothetical protein
MADFGVLPNRSLAGLLKKRCTFKAHCFENQPNLFDADSRPAGPSSRIPEVRMFDPSHSAGIAPSFLAFDMVVQGLNGIRRQLEAAVALRRRGDAAS